MEETTLSLERLPRCMQACDKGLAASMRPEMLAKGPRYKDA